MELERTQIHPKLGLSCTAGGRWRYHARCRLEHDWRSAWACDDMAYCLDFAALHLRDIESFIVACSAGLFCTPIEKFDERAVAEIIQWANKHWTLK